MRIGFIGGGNMASAMTKKLFRQMRLLHPQRRKRADSAFSMRTASVQRWTTVKLFKIVMF